MALRPMGDALGMATMIFADEILPAERIDEIAEASEVNTTKRELDIAKQLVDSLAGDFEPEQLQRHLPRGGARADRAQGPGRGDRRAARRRGGRRARPRPDERPEGEPRRGARARGRGRWPKKRKKPAAKAAASKAAAKKPAAKSKRRRRQESASSRAPPSARCPRGHASSPVKSYRAKRDFKATPEPAPTGEKSSAAVRFVIHEHHARRLHWDLRLERDGVLASWAIPKGLPGGAGREPVRGGDRGPPARVPRLRGRDPRRPVRSGQDLDLGPRHL